MGPRIILFISDTTQYTGYNHTRIVRLLAWLAILSIAVWALVVLSYFIRLTARLVIFLSSRHKRERHA